jgi:hypothetical protein
MENDKLCEVGNFLNFYFRHFLVNQFKPKISAIQKQK